MRRAPKLEHVPLPFNRGRSGGHSGSSRCRRV